MSRTLSTTLPVMAAKDASVRVRKWTRSEYHQAAQIGLFGPEERLELFEGELIQKVGENPPHASTIRRCRIALEHIFAPMDAFISVQSPIVLSDDSEPEPDLAVVQGDVADFDARHPEPADLLLVVEVSDATLTFDRERKAARYPQAGIAEYWIINLPDRRLEAYRTPLNGTFQAVISLGETQTISPLAAPEHAVAIADLLPSVAA